MRLTGATTLSQSGHKSNVNEGVPKLLHISKIEASPYDTV